MTINIQDMAKSMVNIFGLIQDIATETVGLNTLWFRSVPYKNSEDVIFQEYTLSQVECPKSIKVVTSQGDYNPGNFMVDLFQVSYESNFEINIPIKLWQTIFGYDTQPQRDDIVYFEMYHKIYRVASSQVMYTAVSHPMYFKCALTKYVPMKKEDDIQSGLNETIEEMTVATDTLFGKAISEEVSDAVPSKETEYVVTTRIDPLKDFDINCIVDENLTVTDGNIVSHAYYNFSIAEKPVVYKLQEETHIKEDRRHWIFSCWFRIEEDPTSNKSDEKPLRMFKLYMKDKKSTYFRISTTLKLKEGDAVTIKRGNLISVTGTVVTQPCESGLFVEVPATQMNKATKKLTGWETSGTFSISKNSSVNIIKSNDDVIDITLYDTANTFGIKFGKFNKEFKSKKNIDFSKWSYLAIDFSDENCRLVYEQIDRDGMGKLFMHNYFDDTVKNVYSKNDFIINEFMIDSLGSHLQIRNIRLYENEYPMEDTYKLDMMSAVTRNESKCIIVDAPNVPDNHMFYSPVR